MLSHLIEKNKIKVKHKALYKKSNIDGQYGIYGANAWNLQWFQVHVNLTCKVSTFACFYRGATGFSNQTPIYTEILTQFIELSNPFMVRTDMNI